MTAVGPQPGDVTQAGPSATAIARDMVTRYGMSAQLGERELRRRGDYAETTAQAVDREVRSLMDAAYREATAIISRERDLLELLAHPANKE